MSRLVDVFAVLETNIVSDSKTRATSPIQKYTGLFFVQIIKKKDYECSFTDLILEFLINLNLIIIQM